MQDYIEISTTPDLEDCVQVKSNSDYLPAMREEAYRYLAMLKKRFPFAGEVFRIKTCPHDFGSYLQIKILYEQGTKSESLAYFIENYQATGILRKFSLWKILRNTKQVRFLPLTLTASKSRLTILTKLDKDTPGRKF